jgi:aconitate hydratase
MTQPHQDPFGSRAVFETGSGTAVMYRLNRLEEEGIGAVSRLPYSLKVILEAILRRCDGLGASTDDVSDLVQWQAAQPSSRELPFVPSRVLLQDYTGLPAVADLAALRSAMHRLGGDPKRINPITQVDLVVDHSVQVDRFGSLPAFAFNTEREFERNRERYEFLRWGQKAFANFRVIPPSTGIVHQVNLEYLASVVQTRQHGGDTVALPDSLVGTDSHTTMINGLGIVGWGVGGIEAEAAMLGQPVYILTPEVVGVHMKGSLNEGVTATDLVLTVTQSLRETKVVGKFVEFFGEGVETLSLPDRATISNMCPEYGATIGFFPPDAEAMRYLQQTGRDETHVELVEEYLKRQGLFGIPKDGDIEYSSVLTINLDEIEPSISGPKRPQDRIVISKVKETFSGLLTRPITDGGYGLSESDVPQRQGDRNETGEITHGTVVIAAITSCTNTSNPSVMIGAGLLAKKAVERGLRVPDYVKTSLAPGSRVVTEYLNQTGLLRYLEKLGFGLVGYGCTTCIGNSGPLDERVQRAIDEENLVTASVLSGNRNFEARVHRDVKANFLMSPPLVVALALAGTIDIDLTSEPLGYTDAEEAVYLADVWPTSREITALMSQSVDAATFRRLYAQIDSQSPDWDRLVPPKGGIYRWSEASTYIQKPPFFENFKLEPERITDISGARILALLGDSVTTDHISPAGAIGVDSPAGNYLIGRNVPFKGFNTYGSRRGNDRVMTRGTFANNRVKNLMLPGVEGGYTLKYPSREQTTIYEAAQYYAEDGIPLVVFAGAEYGSGSSRDWAAKGARLLGVKAVVAESFERIHRSNLIGMGVLPLQFQSGDNIQSLNLDGSEIINITGVEANLEPRQTVNMEYIDEAGAKRKTELLVRIDTPVEVEYYRHGGILNYVLRNLMAPG